LDSHLFLEVLFGIIIVMGIWLGSGRLFELGEDEPYEPFVRPYNWKEAPKLESNNWQMLQSRLAYEQIMLTENQKALEAAAKSLVLNQKPWGKAGPVGYGPRCRYCGLNAEKSTGHCVGCGAPV
jgi:hypothetical protein